MLLQCNNCGAPLDARTAKTSIKCNYCGSVHVTESLPVQQHQVPVGWKPPPVWVAPAQFAAAGQNLNYRRTMAGIQAIIWISVLVPVVLGVSGAAVAVGSHPVSGGSGSRFGGSWNGKSTLMCANLDHQTVAGVTTSRLGIDLQTGNLCQLDVKDSTLRAFERALVAYDGSHVNIQGGRIDSDAKAVEARGASTIELHNVTITISGGKGDVTVIDAAGGSHVDLYDCHVVIQGGGARVRVVDASNAARVTFHGGHVSGRHTWRAVDGAEVHVLGSEPAGEIETSGLGKVDGVRAVGGRDKNDDPGAPHGGKHRGRH